MYEKDCWADRNRHWGSFAGKTISQQLHEDVRALFVSTREEPATGAGSEPRGAPSGTQSAQPSAPERTGESASPPASSPPAAAGPTAPTTKEEKQENDVGQVTPSAPSALPGSAGSASPQTVGTSAKTEGRDPPAAPGTDGHERQAKKFRVSQASKKAQQKCFLGWKHKPPKAKPSQELVDLIHIATAAARQGRGNFVWLCWEGQSHRKWQPGHATTLVAFTKTFAAAFLEVLEKSTPQSPGHYPGPVARRRGAEHRRCLLFMAERRVVRSPCERVRERPMGPQLQLEE